MTERIRARYFVETADDPRRAVEVMAGEQSSGTFVAVPGETPELKERAGARVERLTPLEDVATPSLPGAKKGAVYHRCEVELSWPIENLGPSLPNLVATVAGNLFELQQFSGLRLLDIDLPPVLRRTLSGPAVRHRGHAAPFRRGERPVDRHHRQAERRAFARGHRRAGRDPRQGRHRLRQGRRTAGRRAALPVRSAGSRGDGGDRPPRPTHRQEGDVRRQRHRRPRRDAAAARYRRRSWRHLHHGEPQLGRPRRHDRASPSCASSRSMRTATGGDISHAIRLLGWSYPAWSKLWRLAGADHMHVNGLRNKFSEPDDSVIQSAKSLPHADVRGQALHRDAGLQLGPDRGPSG